MLGWFLAGLLAGVLGSLVTWALLRRWRRPASLPVPELRPEPPSPPAAEPDDEVRQVLAANQRAVADLEGRFRDRKQAAGSEEALKRPRPPRKD